MLELVACSRRTSRSVSLLLLLSCLPHVFVLANRKPQYGMSGCQGSLSRAHMKQISCAYSAFLLILIIVSIHNI